MVIFSFLRFKRNHMFEIFRRNSKGNINEINEIKIFHIFFRTHYHIMKINIGKKIIE